MSILNKALKIILTIIIALVSVVLSITVTLILTELLMTSNDYLFYEHNQFWGEFLIALSLIPAIFLSIFLMKKLNLSTQRQIEKNERLITFWKKIGLFKIPIIVVYIILFYFSFTNVTMVTEDKIVVKTPFNPIGKSYNYSEVEEIYAGFGDKFISCNEYEEKGNFYYQITLDGKKIIFTAPSVNPEIERYEDNTYLELEEFDQKLCKLKIPKTSSSKFRDDSYYDKEIIERFIRIINNK